MLNAAVVERSYRYGMCLHRIVLLILLPSRRNPSLGTIYYA